MDSDFDLALTQADIDRFAKMGIDTDLLRRAQVRRATDREAREIHRIRFALDKSVGGILFLYRDPITNSVVTCRIRRDNPDISPSGKPVAKYLSRKGDQRHLYFAPNCAELLSDPIVPVV